METNIVINSVPTLPAFSYDTKPTVSKGDSSKNSVISPISSIEKYPTINDNRDKKRLDIYA